MRLVHVSETPGIARFEPRPSELHHEPVVWAIDDVLLHLYLSPRDCPRVCFRTGPGTTPDDRARFLAPHGPERVVVVTADHGEAFGEHGTHWHGVELWEELVRVPLLIRVPGVAHREGMRHPRRDAVAARHVDVVERTDLAIVHRVL